MTPDVLHLAAPTDAVSLTAPGLRVGRARHQRRRAALLSIVCGGLLLAGTGMAACPDPNNLTGSWTADGNMTVRYDLTQQGDQVNWNAVAGFLTGQMSSFSGKRSPAQAGGPSRPLPGALTSQLPHSVSPTKALSVAGSSTSSSVITGTFTSSEVWRAAFPGPPEGQLILKVSADGGTLTRVKSDFGAAVWTRFCDPATGQ